MNFNKGWIAEYFIMKTQRHLSKEAVLTIYNFYDLILQLQHILSI